MCIRDITTAGHFLQEEVPNEIAEALIRVIEEITDSQTQKN